MDEQSKQRKRLRATRRAAGLTQTKLARMAGLTKATICNYELGNRMLRQSNLMKLEQALAYYSASQKMAAALFSQREEQAFEREIERLEQRAEAFREFKQRIATSSN